MRCSSKKTTRWRMWEGRRQSKVPYSHVMLEKKRMQQPEQEQNGRGAGEVYEKEAKFRQINVYHWIDIQQSLVFLPPQETSLLILSLENPRLHEARNLVGHLNFLPPAFPQPLPHHAELVLHLCQYHCYHTPYSKHRLTIILLLSHGQWHSIVRASTTPPSPLL